MPTTSSSYAGNTLQTKVEREPQQLNTGLDKLADYVSAYKPRASSAQQSAAFRPMGYAVPAGMDGGQLPPQTPAFTPAPIAAPITERMMDPQGRWSNWVDPREAELYNSGRVLGGSTPIGPNLRDEYLRAPTGGR